MNTDYCLSNEKLFNMLKTFAQYMTWKNSICFMKTATDIIDVLFNKIYNNYWFFELMYATDVLNSIYDKYDK